MAQVFFAFIIASILASVANKLQKNWITYASIFSSTIAAILSIFLLSQADLHNITDTSNATFQRLFYILHTDTYSYGIGFQTDALSCIWTCATSVLCTFTCIYAIGYMKTHKRFLIYNNLFAACFITFIASNNLLQMYIGLELTALLSYFLVNYYYHKAEANKATALRVFLWNKLGDAFFLFGCVLAFAYYDSLDFAVISHLKIERFNVQAIICICFIVSACVKAAQLGFIKWLTDAMIAPTPASAFLHTSTIVSSGAFILLRLFHSVCVSDEVQTVIIAYLLISAIVSALLALRENDLKRILAYSTSCEMSIILCSIVYGNHTVPVLLFIIHTFTKCAMFFGVGSIIKSLSNERNIMKMGGLLDLMPKTYSIVILTIAFYLDIIPSGIGFFEHFQNAHMTSYVILFTVRMLTVLCFVRVIYSVFHAPQKTEQMILDYIRDDRYVLFYTSVAILILNVLVRFIVFSHSEDLSRHDVAFYFFNIAFAIIGFIVNKRSMLNEKMLQKMIPTTQININGAAIQSVIENIQCKIEDTIWRKLYIYTLMGAKYVSNMILTSTIVQTSLLIAMLIICFLEAVQW